MSVNYTDFDKIWASASPLTPYEFSENNYKAGWNFVGATPPSRQMWDAFMKNADEKLQYLYNHESVPVGHEYFTFNPNVPQGSLPLFGGEYSRETYSTLWAWVQQQTGYLKTEAEWQQLYTTNAGNVPFYSDGDGSTTFRVPSLKCWVKGANGTVSEVGSYLAAGLPNIEGSLQGYTTASNGSQFASQFSSGAGALLPAGTVTQGFGADFSAITPKQINSYIGFDASKHNSIYGNSTTVQPSSIVGMWLVKAYGVVEDTGTIDEQQYIDDRFNALKTYVDGKFDYVVDKGTNYIRYDSGLQMCFDFVSVSMSGAESAGGGGYYTYRKAYQYNFPVPFVTPVVAFANAKESVNYWLASVNDIYTTHLTGMIMGNSNTATKTVYAVVFGWWK